MTRKRKILGIKLMPSWLILFLLIASGAGAAMGSLVAGKVTGDISVVTAGSAGGLQIGAPLCDTIKHTPSDAIEVSANDTSPVIGSWLPVFGFSEITDFSNLAFSDDMYQVTAGSFIRISQQIYRFYVGDGDNINKLEIIWEGYGKTGGTLRVYDNTGAAWGMAETIGTADDTLTIKITDSTDVTISEAVSSTGYVYVQAFLGAVNNALFTDYTAVTATYSAIDISNWAGFHGPEIADREFPIPTRCIGVHSDDQTGFEAASELGVGDWWIFMLPVRNGGAQDVAAKFTMEVPSCLNVYLMSPDEVGHPNPRITDIVRSGANIWTFNVAADADKQDNADYLYVILNAHDDCGPDYYTITGIIEALTFAPPVAITESPPAVPGVTSVYNIVDSSGNFTQDVYPQSDDGLVMLTINTGTVGLTAGGDPLSEITIHEMASPPPPPADGSVIGLTYELGPSGATFNPPIRITFTYDPADIPPGVLESNLKLAWWDSSISDWVLLTNIVVDTVNKKISADVSHFTTFTPLGFASPTVETLAETSLTAISATLNGNLTDTGNAPNVNLYFQWGTNTAYGNTVAAVPASASAAGAFSVGLANLTPLTTYHYRAMADGGNHGITYGADMSFTTPEVCTVNTTGATNVTGLGATLNGDLTSLNLPPAQLVAVGFELGTDTSYTIVNGLAGQVTTTSATGPFSISLSGPAFFSSNTTYHYRAWAYDGTSFYYGADMTFTTPVVATVNTTGATGVTALSATLTGNLTSLNVPAGLSVAVGFELGTDTSYAIVNGLNGQVTTTNSTGPFSVSLVGPGYFVENTTYHYRAWAYDGLNFYYGADMTFTTPVLATVSTTAANNITGITANLTGELTSLSVPSGLSVAVGFDLGTDTTYSLFNGLMGQAATLGAPGTFSFDTSAWTGLTPNTTYHYRVWAYDSVQSKFYYGADMTFTTPTLVTVLTTGANNVTAVSANLTGELTNINIPAAAPGFFYGFELGTDTTYQILNGLMGLATMTPTATPVQFSFDTSVIPIMLSPNTTYHYRAWAYDGANFYCGPDATFTTAILGTVTTTAANNITGFSANLTGSANLNVPAGYPGAAVGFNLGTSSGNYNILDDTFGIVGVGTSGAFSLNTIDKLAQGVITAFLDPQTTYYYRAFIWDGVSQYVYGNEMSFTTGNLTDVFTVATNNAVDITSTSANLTGELTAINLPASIIALGVTAPVGFELEFSANQTVVLDAGAGYVGMLGGTGPYSLLTTTAGATLLPNTEYRFRAYAVFPHPTLGNIFNYGEWKTFRTDP